MSPVDRINAVADVWERFCVDGLVQGAVGLLIVSLVWRLIRKRSASQLGYWLFLLVLLKPFIPIQILIPDTLLTGQTVTAPWRRIQTPYFFGQARYFGQRLR